MLAKIIWKCLNKKGRLIVDSFSKKFLRSSGFVLLDK